MNRGVPIEAAIERWVEFAGRFQIVVAGHVVGDLVAIFLMDTVHGETRKHLCIALLSLGIACKRETSGKQSTEDDNYFCG